MNPILQRLNEEADAKRKVKEEIDKSSASASTAVASQAVPQAPAGSANATADAVTVDSKDEPN